MLQVGTGGRDVRRNPRKTVIDYTIRSYRERIAMPFQRIQIPAQGIGCPLDRFLRGLAVDVKPLECRTVRMESVAVRLYDNGNPDSHPSSRTDLFPAAYGRKRLAAASCFQVP